MQLRCIYKHQESNREHYYESLSFSKQSAERVPPSTLSMAISFSTAMAEKAIEGGQQLSTMNTAELEALLDVVFDEYNQHGVVGTNEKYQLKTRDRKAVTNLILYMDHEALSQMQMLLNTCKEAHSPFSRDILESTRHLKGMKPASLSSGVTHGANVWETMQTVSVPKQVMFLKRVKEAHAKNMKHAEGVSALKHWSQDLWNSECNYSCWLQWGLHETEARKEVVDGVETCVLAADDIADVMTKGLQGEFKDHFEAAWMEKDPKYCVEDLPWFPAKATQDEMRNPFSEGQQVSLSQALQTLTQEQKAKTFELDVLSLANDISTVLNYYSNLRESKGSLKRAKAAKLKFELAKGMALVNGWMPTHCEVVAVDDLSSENVDNKLTTFINAAVRETAPGKITHVSVGDLTKFGKVSDAEIDKVISKLHRVCLLDPSRFIGILICPNRVGRKVLRGERGMRAKIETKLENKGFVPYLCVGGRNITKESARLRSRIYNVGFGQIVSKGFCYDIDVWHGGGQV